MCVISEVTGERGEEVQSEIGVMHALIHVCLDVFLRCMIRCVCWLCCLTVKLSVTLWARHLQMYQLPGLLSLSHHTSFPLLFSSDEWMFILNSLKTKSCEELGGARVL